MGRCTRTPIVASCSNHYLIKGVRPFFSTGPNERLTTTPVPAAPMDEHHLAFVSPVLLSYVGIEGYGMPPHAPCQHQSVNETCSPGFFLNSVFLQINGRCGPTSLASLLLRVTIGALLALRLAFPAVLFPFLQEPGKWVWHGDILKLHPYTAPHSPWAGVFEAEIRHQTCPRRSKRSACSASLVVIYAKGSFTNICRKLYKNCSLKSCYNVYIIRL